MMLLLMHLKALVSFGFTLNFAYLANSIAWILDNHVNDDVLVIVSVNYLDLVKPGRHTTYVVTI